MITIDADAHVVETERTWDFMEKPDQKYRPQVVSSPSEPSKYYWMVDGKIRGSARQVVTAGQLDDLSSKIGRNITTPREAREMENVGVRVKHMDELGVDVQVLHSTIFIRDFVSKPDSEIAICNGWNRWLADIWQQGGGRLRWTCVLPLRTMDHAIQQLRYSHEHGACGVFMRAIEGERVLHDPYFDPLYEEAVRLNMPMIVHIGNANTYTSELLSQFVGTGSTFWTIRLMTVGACHSIILSGLMDRFPGLRYGFVEASSQWVPYMLADLKRRLPGLGKQYRPDLLKQQRLYVTMQSDDDIDYVMKWAGEDNLVIGTDYGHTDQSSEIEALRALRQNEQIEPRVVEKILDHNPRALYGLSV